jgi:hypothetical protein
MRIESSVAAVSWIPPEAVEGLPKLPFSVGLAHYDQPPPDVLEDIDALREADAFREANELRAWIDVDDGKIVDNDYSGRGHIGVTRVSVGRREVSVAAVAMPTLQHEPEVGEDYVRFVQSAGGRTGVPAPRRVRGKPFFQVASALAWTTLGLTIYTAGTSQWELVGASAFPRHYVYDHEGRLIAQSGTIDFARWYRESYGQRTPWGGEDSPALMRQVQTELERELSRGIFGRELPKPRTLKPGDTLVEQGERGEELFLLLDGVLEVERDGDVVAEVSPGAILGELALVESGVRTATLRATTPAKVISVEPGNVDREALEQLAAGRRPNGD